MDYKAWFMWIIMFVEINYKRRSPIQVRTYKSQYDSIEINLMQFTKEVETTVTQYRPTDALQCFNKPKM